ncbi:hypothetical protein PL318_26390 [Burkholderia pseudomallei]|uniref:hypothetical protein n=1 Tax=Burkholderia pseudomallei TaxID=28450 RepID=UPI0005F2A2C9|nr:hypothetical protein [Burkholderia pseudomallei]KJR91139.1 hypothetical protein VP95_24775 [Burkholderia pseudomallei]MDA5593579.1 hypothetical protein [Burkholderia pseudomallei]OND64175.1 hypothetical protein AQ937_05980 [Burkholderia pseudomallei]OND67818.1 hypothetical protein AQ936_28175 [Burkholderia pseudomallei]OND74328.1 hypothetical protein AQ939_05990 [Burkholderia pseudomallei]
MPNMTVIRTTSPEQYAPAAGPTMPSASNVDGRTLTVQPSTLSTGDLVKAPPEHLAKMAGVRLGISSAGDRLHYLERNGVTLKKDKVLTAARYSHNVTIDHKNASNLQFQLNRMRIGEISLPRQARPDFLEVRNALDVIPLVLPDRNEKHTIPIDKYLTNRLSSGAVEQARHHGCEIFCGSGREEMLNHYARRGFDRAISISSNTSTRFDLFTSSSNGKSLLVLSGMSGATRIKHQLFQLHFADVDLNMVKLVGDIDSLKAKGRTALRKELSQLPSIPNKTLFIGARWQIMEYLGKQLFNVDDSEKEGTGYSKLDVKEHKVADFVFDTATLNLDGRRHLVAALRMPNGDLAYDAMKGFLDHGFNQVIMCGAGGRLAGDAQVGDYMLLERSQYGDQSISLTRECIRVPSTKLFENAKLTSNVTVDSPLQETRRWLDENQEAGNVDVESAHILRALTEAGPNVEVLPGLFVSDVVGEHPLEGKISSDDAYRRLQEFVTASLGMIREQDTPPA